MHRRVPTASAAIALLALVASFGPAAAQQTASFCSTPNVAIPDNSTGGPGSVSDLLIVAQDLTIQDLDVYIRANHTWSGDLQFTLSDGTTTVTLIDRPGVPTSSFGCSGDNYDVTVDDEGPDTAIENQCGAAPPAITGTAPGGDPPNTSLLAAYDGQSTSGTWTLTATDNATGDTGTLLEWCLNVTAAAAPAISLVKTVGTAPGVCAATSNLTVAPGTTVYYCYTVTNTGDVTLNSHDLVDDQLGTIFTGLAYALTPGSSVSTVAAGLSIPAVINAPVTNVATWTAYESPTGGVSATNTGTATVTVEDLPSVLEIPTLGTVGASLLGLALAGLGLGALRRRRG